MTIRIACVASFLCLLLSAPVALAEDEISPAERFRKACAALPAPTEAAYFDWKGEIVIDGQVYGGCRFMAHAEDRDGVAHWKTVDIAQIGQAFRLEMTAGFSRGMALLEASGTDKNDEEDITIDVKPEEGGWHVRIQPKEGEAREGHPKHSGPTLGGPSSRILFLRSVITEKADYEWVELHPSRVGKKKKDKPVLLTVRARVLGQGMFKGVKALLASVKEEKKTSTYAFDPTTRAFIGVAMTEEGNAAQFEMLPEGTMESSIPKDILRKPAESPLVAVGRYYLAAGTHDVDLLDKTFHWPTVFKHFKEGQPDYEGTQDDLRKLVLGNYAKRWEGQKKEDPAVVELFLRGSLRSMKVEATEGNMARVGVDPRVKGIGGQKWLVVEVEGLWYIAK